MPDCYVYTSKGYRPVDADWENPTPLWVMIVEMLRDFPRTGSTIQYGIEIIYGEKIPLDILGGELCRLASLGFVAMTDSGADALTGYKLTHWGLLLQCTNTEFCPHCGTELVIDGDGYRQCGACELVFYSRTSDTDETLYHLYDGDAMLLVFPRRLPEMPETIIVCPPVPDAERHLAERTTKEDQ